MSRVGGAVEVPTQGLASDSCYLLSTETALVHGFAIQCLCSRDMLPCCLLDAAMCGELQLSFNDIASSDCHAASLGYKDAQNRLL